MLQRHHYRGTVPLTAEKAFKYIKGPISTLIELVLLILLEKE
jgi:hypothetical protein